MPGRPSSQLTPSPPAEAASRHTACPFCSEEILATARKCKHCGEMLDPALRLQASTPVQVNVQNVQTLAPQAAIGMVPSASRVEPGTAALLSFLWPGAGQIYARQVGSGIAWMLMVFVGYLFFVVPGLVLHIACVFSAAGTARHQNRRAGHY